MRIYSSLIKYSFYIIFILLIPLIIFIYNSKNGFNIKFRLVSGKEKEINIVGKLNIIKPENEGEIRQYESNNKTFDKNYNSYKEALENIVSKDNVVIISTADGGYLDMTLNFYIGSIKRHGITNFMMLCTEINSCDIFKKYGIPSFFYQTEQAGEKSSRYNSREFRRKTHIKTNIVLDALKLGFNVVLTDVDIVYLKNPFISWPCDECDLQVSSDFLEANSGFYFVKSNAAGIELHKIMQKLASPRNSNQKTLNPAMKKLKRERKIKTITLPNSKWPCGIVYFENQHRMWVDDPPCPNCILIHNNWIETSEAKIYRFKENGLWVLDSDGYYSNPYAKYLTYNNPIDFGKGHTRNIEGKTLSIAIGIAIALNRILILPSFHCDECKYGACKSPSKRCALNVRFHLQEFDKTFKKIYREHVFLKSSLVPQNIKDSQSSQLIISSTLDYLLAKNISENFIYSKKFLPISDKTGANSDEIRKWFGKGSEYENVSVLNFAALYEAFDKFINNDEQLQFSNMKKLGFVKGGYRQYRWET